MLENRPIVLYAPNKVANVVAHCGSGVQKVPRGEKMIYWRKSHDFEIVNLLDNGQTPKQVAIELSISIWTVYRACRRFHGKQIRQKTQKTNRVKTEKSL